MFVTLATIWWAETVTAPKREIKMAMSVKELTSKKVERPIGMPMRNWAHMALGCGQ